MKGKLLIEEIKGEELAFISWPRPEERPYLRKSFQINQPLYITIIKYQN
jgi:hypothetical protein